MGIEAFIIHYGYIVVLVGTFFEGETILVLAGFLAHRGYMDFRLVVMLAFAGTLAGDQLYYYIGRIKGVSYFERRKSWKTKSERVFRLARRHQVLVMTVFRFIYGIRTVTPFIMGASGIDPLRFLVFNALGALLWAPAVAGLGYVFGHAAKIILQDIKRYELVLMGVIVLGGLVIWMFHVFGRKDPRR
jgi:membrane protein DedA with SNARE-associated domain